ncbi:hypothetical protein HNR59_000656 [Aquamicrobium lusatiense]|uniref:Uncharacterized protein n=1 Tax=Aquamicrobium lusatiense TaxID=89772 RepID=A0A7W9VU45_9HYPH|nr:hypothetical protein [Aquamicrobium lusatiense]
MAKEIENIGSSVRAPPAADCQNEVMVDRAGAN